VVHGNSYKRSTQYIVGKHMKRAYVPYVFAWLLIVSIFAVQGVTLAKGPPAVNGNFTFTSTTGLAYKINDTSVFYTLDPGSVTIEGTYREVGKNTQMVKLDVTSGWVTINGVTHDLDRGKGVYNPTTGKIVITALVDVQPGEHGRNLILHGTISSDYYYSQLGGGVTFGKPQSKLSGAYFLAIEGTVAFAS
jgi:hypothetical protein